MAKNNDSRTAKYAGLILAGTGLAHFARPQIFEPITKPAFPESTRQRVYAHGGIETALGLGLSARPTRRLAVISGIGYLGYLVANTVRQK